MTSLRGYTQLTLRRHRQEASIDERTRTALEVVDEQAAKLTHLVEQLLDVSRIQAGKLTLTRLEIDVAQLTRDVVELAGRRSTDHEIVVSADGRVPALVESLRLEQVLVNLVDNAIKYSPEGGRIDVSVRYATPEIAEIAVRDRGIGIAPEKRDHIFDRFYQVGGSITVQGLGLGLHISRQIVELHGGTIRAEFPDDGGSRFVVQLPALAASALAEKELVLVAD